MVFKSNHHMTTTMMAPVSVKEQPLTFWGYLFFLQKRSISKFHRKQLIALQDAKGIFLLHGMFTLISFQSSFHPKVKFKCYMVICGFLCYN